MALTRNIVTDDGAPTNGSTYAGTAFMSFNTWALANQGGGTQIILTIPAHTYNLDPVPNWVAGIKDLVVIGTGATLAYGASANGTGTSNTGLIIPTTSYLFHSAYAGSSSITMITAADAATFPVGDWVYVVGVDLQNGGYPPNPAFYEVAQVLTSNSTSGVITFTAPLRNSYLETWPLIASEQGGPASLMRLNQAWDSTLDFRGLTFTSNFNAQIYIGARTVILTDVTSSSSGNGGTTPTGCQNLTWNNVTNGGDIETDKFIENWTINGGALGNLNLGNMTGARSTMIRGASITLLNGTPENAVVQNCTIGTLGVGCLTYGRTNSAQFADCTIGDVTYMGTAHLENVRDHFTMSGGVIKVLKSYIASGPGQGKLNWAIPGNDCIFGTYTGSEIPTGPAFYVFGISEDGTYVYVSTNQSGGFPTISDEDPTNGLSIFTHPCRNFTCINCTGSADAVDLSQHPPGRPIFTYSRRTYDGTNWGDGPPVNILGNLVSVIINVTKAYSGSSGTLLFRPFGSGGGNDVNLKVVGQREIYPASAVGSQSGDSIAAKSSWFNQPQVPWISNDIRGELSGVYPAFTVEFVTDQGLAPLVVPRLRLHA